MQKVMPPRVITGILHRGCGIHTEVGKKMDPWVSPVKSRASILQGKPEDDGRMLKCMVIPVPDTEIHLFSVVTVIPG